MFCCGLVPIDFNHIVQGYLVGSSEIWWLAPKTPRGPVKYVSLRKSIIHWFRYWFIARSVPGHYRRCGCVGMGGVWVWVWVGAGGGGWGRVGGLGVGWGGVWGWSWWWVGVYDNRASIFTFTEIQSLISPGSAQLIYNICLSYPYPSIFLTVTRTTWWTPLEIDNA